MKPKSDPAVGGHCAADGCQPGQQRQTNDLIMVLEAMKMETYVTAPAPGKIKKIHVAPGGRRKGKSSADGIRVAPGPKQ